jgi:hypothetical protein
LSGDARHADQVLHENGIARRPDETIFIRDEILLKPAFDRLRSLEKKGFDHAGHHHQPPLSAILQGGAIRHSNAESSLDLS